MNVCAGECPLRCCRGARRAGATRAMVSVCAQRMRMPDRGRLRVARARWPMRIAVGPRFAFGHNVDRLMPLWHLVRNGAGLCIVVGGSARGARSRSAPSRSEQRLGFGSPSRSGMRRVQQSYPNLISLSLEMSYRGLSGSPVARARARRRPLCGRSRVVGAALAVASSHTSHRSPASRSRRRRIQ